MMALFTYTLFFLLSMQVFAAVVPDGPAHVTSSVITILTVSTECYTKTINVPKYGSDCISQKCPPSIPQCIGTTKITVTVPPSNPTCTDTPTVVLPGPCATCHKGCAQKTSTIWQTAHAPAPSLSVLPISAPTHFPDKRTEGKFYEQEEARKREAACVTTVWRSSTQQKGLTYTYHPLTETIISLVACKGCDLVVSEVQVPGPGISRSVTVTDMTPDVVTVYTCQ